MISKKSIFATLFGSMLELYEFAAYVYLAPILAKVFFAHKDPVTSLLLTLTIFAAGFVMRPIGGIFFGHFGDRLGRKAMLATTIILMAFSTTLIGLLPTALQIGIWAPILLMLLRCVQGFSMGGEFPGGVIYIQEMVPKNKRGFYSGLIWVFGSLAWLLGAGMTALLSKILGDVAMHAWGWRIPFLTGLISGAIGLYLRLGLPESIAFVKLQERIVKIPLLTVCRTAYFKILCVSFWFLLPSFCFLLMFTYMPTFLQSLGFFSLTKILEITSLDIFILLILNFSFGLLADCIPHSLVLRAGIILLLLCGLFIYPYILQHNLFYIMLSQCLFAVGIACIYSVLPIFMVHYFPINLRYSALGLIFNVMLAFGALILPPLQTVWAVHWHQPGLPGMVVAFIAMIGLIFTYFMPHMEEA